MGQSTMILGRRSDYLRLWLGLGHNSSCKRISESVQIPCPNIIRCHVKDFDAVFVRKLMAEDI